MNPMTSLVRSLAGAAVSAALVVSATATFIAPTPVAALEKMMETEVDRDPTNQPELQIETNDNAEYGILARVLAAAKNANRVKIGFVQN